EYGCKVDAKGRLMFPAKLRKQMEEIIHQGLVLNRDIFEKCLVLYPKPEWEKVNAEMSRLSRYNRKHQVFQRKFMKGATMMELDGTGRLLIPSSLLEYAGISADKNEIIITGMLEKIEIWNKDAYNALVLEEDEDFGDLAEEIRREIEGPKMPPIN
ncbi:MAG: MraZ protein, partial [Flavobacteriales bacterium]